MSSEVMWLSLSIGLEEALQDKRWLSSVTQAASENKYPVMGQKEEGKDPAPGAAAENEKLIIVRRPEMHPMVIEPSGTNLMEKEATSGHIVQTWGAAFQINSTVLVAPSEKAMAPHSSAPAWRIPGTGEPGRLQSMGWRRVRHD